MPSGSPEDSFNSGQRECGTWHGTSLLARHLVSVLCQTFAVSKTEELSLTSEFADMGHLFDFEWPASCPFLDWSIHFCYSLLVIATTYLTLCCCLPSAPSSFLLHLVIHVLLSPWSWTCSKLNSTYFHGLSDLWLQVMPIFSLPCDQNPDLPPPVCSVGERRSLPDCFLCPLFCRKNPRRVPH